MNKKAYFFLIDAIIGLLVLSIGITLVVTSTVFQEPVRQTELLNVDLLSAFTKQIKDKSGVYCGIDGALAQDGNITDTENTFLQQFGEFYYRYQQGCTFCLDLIRNCIKEVVDVNSLAPHSMELKINHEYIYAVNNSQKNLSFLVIPQRSITFGTYGNQYYGPYLAEIIVWN